MEVNRKMAETLQKFYKSLIERIRFREISSLITVEFLVFLSKALLVYGTALYGPQIMGMIRKVSHLVKFEEK